MQEINEALGRIRKLAGELANLPKVPPKRRPVMATNLKFGIECAITEIIKRLESDRIEELRARIEITEGRVFDLEHGFQETPVFDFEPGPSKPAKRKVARRKK